MKLHLPKRLLTALIAAISFIAPAALTLGSAAWGEDASHWDITQDHSGDTQTIGSGETFYIGNGTNDAKGSGNSSTVFNSGKLTVESGGKLFIHGFTDSDRDIDTTGKLKIESEIEVQGGGTLHLEDGSYYFSGNINITGGAENVSTIHSRWDKGFLFDNLTGDETASLKLTGESSNTTFTLQGDGAYAGHIEVDNGNRDTRLVINSAGALTSTASIAITGSNTKLAINTEAITLSHLSAEAGNSLILAKNTGQMGSVAAVDASTVTIRNASASDATFSGTIGSGITLEVASGAYQNFGAVTNNGQMVLNGTVNITTSITGNGSVEVGGLLTLADYNELYNISYTYSNPDGGTNSGLRTGYTGYFSQGALTVGETGRLAIANSADASITNAGYATGTIQQGDGIYYVNEALTYNAATMAADAVTSILVSSTGTLNVAGSSVGKSLSNAGTVNYSMDGGSVNVDSLFQTNTGVVKVDMNASNAETLTGTASLSADLGAGTGTVRVENAASFTNAGYKINSQKLVLNNVANATISGSSDCRISTSLELIQSNLTITRGDAFDYNDSSQLTYKIGAGSSLDVGSNRQSIRSNHIIEMAGGILKGAGATFNSYVYGIDFYDGGRFNTSADSRIETNVGGHNSGTIQFDVNRGTTLVMTGSLVGNTSFSKTEAGVLSYQGASFSQTLNITGGEFEYVTDEARTHDGTISGTATFTKSGTGALTLGSANTSVSTLKVKSGELIYNSTTDTSHTLTGDAGSKFTKQGNNTLTVSSDGYAGDIDVSSGILKFDGSTDSTTNNSSRKITVQDGASLDLNGKARHYKVELNQGATLTNTGDATGNGQRQLHTITLKGDATVSGTGDFYLINDGYTTTYLDLNQHKLTKTGTNTFYLKNTTVQSAGVIRVEEGTVQTLSSNAGTLDISKASLEIADGGSFVLAEKNQQIQNLTLEAGGTLTINSGLTLTTMGDVTWNGGAISGNLCLNGTVSQTGGTVDLSNAVLSGTSLTQFDKVGDATLPTESGLYEATYKLIDGSISLTSGEQSAQSTIIVGGHSYALNLNAGTFAVNSNYYVASDDSITISSESGEDPISQATYFYVDGTLNIAGVAGNATTVKDILAYSGGTGKLVLKTEATFTNSIHTVFNGTLSIGEGGTLNFGYAKAAGSDMSSFSKVELDGGTLNYNNLDSTLNNFTVTQNGGAMYVADYKDTYTTPILLAGTTDIQGNFTYKTEFKSYLRIEELTGNGTLTITTETGNNRNDRGAHVIIDSMSGFTGSIVLDPEKDATNRVEVTAALAKGDTLKASQITLNNANKSSFTLTGSGLYDMVDSGADKKVSGLDQADWTGTVKLGSADAGAYDLRLLGNTGSTIQIAEGCTFKTYLNNTGANETHTTFYSAFQLDGNLEINNGWSTRTYIFAGKIAGNGNLVKSTNSFTSKYNFTNDLSGWHGVLENKAGTLTVTLQELASTVDAAITQSGGTLNLNVETTNAATFANAVSVNALTLNQSATFTGSLTATTISIASGKTLTLDNGTTTLGATISGAGGLIKSATGTLTLSGANTYSGGTTISGGVLEITSTSALGSSTTSIADKASLLINTGNSGSITFTANKRLTGAGTMEIASGSTVNVGSSTNNGSAQVQTNVKINGGATLNLTGADALGWGGTATKKITLLGSGAEEGQLAKLTAVGTQTMKTSLDLQGNTKVSGGAFEFFDGSITASGKNNVISSAIYSRNNGTITVTGADDELEVSGNFANRDNYAALITKSGLGTLTISGATNMFHKGFTIGEGKVVVSGTGRTTVQGGVLTISTGAEMEVGANLHVSAGANLGGIISVTGGTADFNGAFTASGANANLTQSGTGVVNLNGDILVESNAGLTLNGVVGIGSTITNNGTLTFTDSITIIGELSNFDAYPEASSGTTSYVDDTGNVRTDGNGFEKVAGLSYWLTDKDSTGTVNYGTITHVSHGTDSYELHQVTEGKNLYFTVGSNVGNIFFVNEAGGAAVSAAEAARATGFELVAGGNLSLAAGAETNANATIRLAGNSSINLAAGSTLHTFAKEGSGTLTLTGSGTYDLGSGVANLGSGISLGSSWTGTVRLTDVVASGMNFETYGNVASKVALNGVSGWFNRDTNNNVHIILEEKGLTFTDYSTAQSYNFGKGISGSGNFVIDARDDTTKPVVATPTIQIGVYEDPSLTWSGKFQVNDIRTDSAANPENAFVQLFLNGNGSYFDSTAESAGVEMNDSAGTLKVFAGHSSVNSVDNNGVAQYTLNDGLTTINGFVKNNSTGRLELTALNNTVFNKEVDVTSMTVNSGKTATMNSTLKTGTLKLGDTATITKAEVETATSMENVKLNEEGITSADETKATKGSVTDAKVTLAALAEGTSFSIEDVTLLNYTAFFALHSMQ